MRYATAFGFSALLTVAPLASTAAQQRTAPAERFPAELDRYIAQARTGAQIPGLAIAIVRNDSVLVVRGYGVRRLGSREPVDERTVFDAASLSKSFTGTMAGILVDRGRLHWDDPVHLYLPKLVLPNAELTSSATLRNFLSHATGLESANMMWVLTAVNRAEVVRRMRYLPVVAQRGQRMLYSNVGFTVAGETAAAAGGSTYELLLRDLLLAPLRMSFTVTYEEAARVANRAYGHALVNGTQQPLRRERQRFTIAAAGTVQSSATDLARWMRLHLNNGVLDGTRFVSDSTMRVLHSIQVPIATTPPMRAARLVEDSVVGYGFGWQIMDYRGHPLIWHTGSGDGQSVYMALLPKDRLGVLVMVNTWAAGTVHMALANRILDTYLGYEPRDWVAEALARVRDGVAAQQAAAREADAMRSSTPPPHQLADYAGEYVDSLYGPVHIRVNGSALTMQMGGGEVADLDFHGGNMFYTRWRDPLYRENYGSHVFFEGTGNAIESLRTQINRDSFRAVRAPQKLRSATR